MSGPMGLTYPIPGDTTNTWGTVLNALLGLVENHDHTSGKGSLVPSAGLGINADVSWASFALTALKGAGFTEVTAASVASYADLVYVQSSDHNLYFRNQAGTNVQITAGNTLNVSIVGGIGGDYSSVGALLSFDDATKRYLLQSQGSPRPWSGLGTADIDLYQKAASIANKVTLKSPNALGASYTVTMPTAVPSATKSLAMTTGGQLQYGGVPQTLVVPGPAAEPTATATYQLTDYLWTLQGSGAQFIIYPISLPVGSTITGWTLYIRKQSGAGNAINAFRRRAVQDTTTDGPNQSNAANNPGYTTLGEAGLSLTIATGEQYQIKVSGGSGAANDFVYQLEVAYTTVS